MSKLLVIKSSILEAASQSNTLTDEFLTQWHQYYPGDSILIRDLALDPIPILDAQLLPVLRPTEQTTLTPLQQRVLALSNTLIAELQAAEVIIITAPMYNFAIPVQLKSYFDLIARAGVTFRYTATGAEGLLTGKRVYAISSRGGYHTGTASDLVTHYLQVFLGFIGLTNIEFIYLEGLALGSEQCYQAQQEAKMRIAQLISPGS